MTHSTKATAALAGAALVSACASAGIKDAGPPPDLTPIANPADVVGPSPVTMPLPVPPQQNYSANSLWRTGAKSFFDDQRANEVGDILTVNIAISDQASVDNSTNRQQSGSTDADVNAMFGLDTLVNNNLPGTLSLNPGLNTSSSTSSSGSGTVNRAETISLTVAAVITSRLPNGNLVIGGSQEVRVNNEVRELLVSGVIRPQDISAENTIPHTKIAQARISYGGRGDLTNLQRARYGQRAAEAIIPF